MKNISESYAFFQNDKKVGEYTKNSKNLRFRIMDNITLEDAISASITLAKHFQMPVCLFFNNKKLNIPYQKTGMPTEQEIINQFQNTK